MRDRKMNIIKKYYQGDNAKNYEEGRSKSLKWRFESDTLEAVIRNVKNEIGSIIDAPVGTGRFIPFYKKELKGKKIYLLDYSDDMLKITKKRKVFFNTLSFVTTKQIRNIFRKHPVVSMQIYKPYPDNYKPKSWGRIEKIIQDKLGIERTQFWLLLKR